MKENVKWALKLSPYLIAVLAFFYLNYKTVDRGEKGGWTYTLSKTGPILLLSIISTFCFRNLSSTLATYTCLSFLMAAAGDFFLSTRSHSVENLYTGLIPFGVAHFFLLISYTNICSSWSCCGFGGGAKEEAASPSKRSPVKKAAGSATVPGAYPRLIWPPFLAAVLLVNGCVAYLVLPRVPANLGRVVIISYKLLLGANVSVAGAYWHFATAKFRKSAGIRLLGLLLFAGSDFLLVLDEYYLPIRKAQLIVMALYYLAQALILAGNLLHEVASGVKAPPAKCGGTGEGVSTRSKTRSQKQD